VDILTIVLICGTTLNFMKSIKKLALTLVIGLSLAFVGCEGACETCSGCLLDEQNGSYCESDFESTTAYNTAISDLETGGCTCE